MDGFSTAFSEITLVLFTTLAPSGAVAYLLMNLPVLFGRVDGTLRQRLDRLSCLPLAITMVGLIASATHLGNPSNALYVFTGVGRSPLSTEVFCAVIFLALAGMYWLYSFALAPRRGLQRVLLVAIDGAAVVFVIATAFAYSVDTIPVWNLSLAPVSLLLNALVGGPLLALSGFAGVGYRPWTRPLVALSGAALVANVAVYGCLGTQLAVMANEMVHATDLVAGFPAYVGVFALLAGVGIVIAWRSRGCEGRSPVVRLAVATACALAGIFLMRFTFYMAHFTVGLGV
ncbi:dimethyl sulfoxide reductase anchor subunit family protein [Adlercreutzia mucosicola]|uniref:dimethyl sulfoxide reductase anchor subunit family protein n=1 Tax=Adlercreutzia mucosicola TaxID=580026 RepID=UPI000426EE2D|nr:DmsC/YnfH family molybdoenzyme membrane anchor subunit [Adlercreutzia mucosicola]MCR2035079.1 dimethyl sulfoxide reductase anchor subunit [Adlercreutzia mucosicola]